VILTSSSWRSVANVALSRAGHRRRRHALGSAREVLSAAEHRTGLSDWGDPHFTDGLHALLGGLRDLDDLTPLGVLTFRRLIDQLLVNRLRFVSDPTPRHELRAPIIITGLPRSGTTLLHRLLGLDPCHHAPPLWELLDPFAASPPALRRLRTRLQVLVKNRLLPALDRKHYTRAETPEECTLLLANSFSSSLLSDMAPLRRYQQWYQSSSHEVAYAEYRRQIEILQARYPDQRLVLKAPAHLAHLPELVRAVPEASLVQTHRDPTECFFSQCSLLETLSRLAIDRPSRTTITDKVQRTFEHDLERNLEFHDQAAAEVLHVGYSGLRADPVATVGAARQHLGLSWSSDDLRRATEYVDHNPQHRFGRHDVVDSDWCVSVRQIDERFADYRDRFAGELG
jgi:hypothetical protein